MNRMRWERRGDTWLYGRDEERSTPRGPAISFTVHELLRWSPRAERYVDMDWQAIAADLEESKRRIEARFMPGQSSK